MNGSSGNEVAFRAATQPGAAGEWEGLRLESGSHSVRHALFSDAATAIDNGSSGRSDLTVASCTFSNVGTGIFHQDTGLLSVTGSSFTDLGAGVGLASNLGPQVTVQDNSFGNCNEAMVMTAASSPTLGGNTASGCATNGTRVFGAGLISVPAVWDDDTMPLVVPDGQILVSSSGSLTVEAGTVVKWLSDFSDAGLVVEGSLTVNGTPAEPVVFTSLRDDSVLGDTNNDGTSSSPSVGDWYGIEVTGGTALLEGVQARYANDGVSSSGGAMVEITQGQFQDCFTGVEIVDSSGFIGDSVIAENGPGIAVGSQATFIVGETFNIDPRRQGRNDIYCNSGADVFFGGGGTLLAQNNWWGEAPPDLAEIQVSGGGTVDTANYFGGVIHDLVDIRPAQLSSSQLELSWWQVTTCTAYRVRSAEDPQFTTLILDQPLPPGTTQFVDAINPAEPVVYYRVLPE